MDETAGPAARCTVTKIALSLLIDRNARLQALVGDEGRGYSRPGKEDPVARRVDGCFGTEARIGVERLDHTTVAATVERAADLEPWGWAECRLATDAVMADLWKADLLWPAVGYPGSHLARAAEESERMRLFAVAYHCEFGGVALPQDPGALAIGDAEVARVPEIADALADACAAPAVKLLDKTGALWSGRVVYTVAFNGAHARRSWDVASAAVDLMFERLHALGLHPDASADRAWAAERARAVRDADAARAA